MNSARKRKLWIIAWVVGILSLATLLVLYALRQNISLFYTPEQIAKGEVPANRMIRIGGMVVKGSIQHSNQDLNVKFAVTDYKQTIQVAYRGVLPDLFRDGQGIVAMGRFDAERQQFIANEILAKHDENYLPPEVKHALKGK